MNQALIISGLAVCAISFSACAQTPGGLEKISETMEKPEVLCGNFVQRKKMVGLKTPVQSSGRFCIHATKGILWRTLKPSRNTVHLTKDSITLFDGDSVVKKVDISGEPSAQFVNDIIFPLIRGDYDRLQRMFDIHAVVQSKQWNAVFKSRDENLSKAINAFLISGWKYVNSITIRETSGNSTHIVFSDIETGRRAIRRDESAFYE
jgi:outer membrane lipoprotein-sorting protein